MKSLTDDIDYDNFKSEVARHDDSSGRSYEHSLHAVWSIMYRFQDGSWRHETKPAREVAGRGMLPGLRTMSSACLASLICVPMSVPHRPCSTNETCNSRPDGFSAGLCRGVATARRCSCTSRGGSDELARSCPDAHRAWHDADRCGPPCAGREAWSL